jgi:hypothetical protein
LDGAHPGRWFVDVLSDRVLSTRSARAEHLLSASGPGGRAAMADYESVDFYTDESLNEDP